MLDVVITNAAQRVWVVLGRSLGRENYGAIRDHAGAGVGRMRTASSQFHSFLDAHDEERARSLEDVQALKVHISSIHHIERACLRQELVEDVDVVDLSLGNLNKRRD